LGVSVAGLDNASSVSHSDARSVIIVAVPASGDPPAQLIETELRPLAKVLARLIASELRLLLIQPSQSAVADTPSNGDGPACDVCGRPAQPGRRVCRRCRRLAGVNANANSRRALPKPKLSAAGSAARAQRNSRSAFDATLPSQARYRREATDRDRPSCTRRLERRDLAAMGEGPGTLQITAGGPGRCGR
jgi:hypothetical protein